MLDGVFAGLEGETPCFYPLRAPDDPDVAAVAETVSRRTQALWRKKGIGASDDGEAEDPLMRDTPWLAGLYAHGVRGRIATGPNTGKRIRTWGCGAGESQEPEPSARPSIVPVPPPASGAEACGHRDSSLTKSCFEFKPERSATNIGSPASNVC